MKSASREQSPPVWRRYLNEEPVAFLLALGLVGGSLYLQIAQNRALLLLVVVIGVGLLMIKLIRLESRATGFGLLTALVSYFVHLLDSKRR